MKQVYQSPLAIKDHLQLFAKDQEFTVKEIKSGALMTSTPQFNKPGLKAGHIQ